MSKSSRTPVAILHMEDNPLDAKLSFLKLESSGLSFSITRVGSEDDFKRAAREKKHDIILCDYKVPNWTGLDAVRWLRSSGFSVPFILVTGFLSEDLAAACIKEGANDYIMKDNLERLPIAIMRALEEAEMLAEGTQTKSALVQAERDLSLSERLYASIVEGAPYGIFQADDSGRILVVNAALTKMLGYKSDAELLNLNIESDVCIAPKEYRAIFEKVDEQNRASHKEVQWRHSKGHSITVRLEGRRIEVKAGGSVVYHSPVEAITEPSILKDCSPPAHHI